MRIDRTITLGMTVRSHHILSTKSVRKCMLISLENLHVGIAAESPNLAKFVTLLL